MHNGGVTKEKVPRHSAELLSVKWYLQVCWCSALLHLQTLLQSVVMLNVVANQEFRNDIILMKSIVNDDVIVIKIFVNEDVIVTKYL